MSRRSKKVGTGQGNEGRKEGRKSPSHLTLDISEKPPGNWGYKITITTLIMFLKIYNAPATILSSLHLLIPFILVVIL